MTSTKLALLVRFAALVALSPTVHRLFAADAAPTPPTAPVAAAQANTRAQPSGARRGGGFRGGPITPEEQAALAKLGELPTWKPGAPDGGYTIAPPFSPAPENAPRDNVPKGKVVSFRMDL